MGFNISLHEIGIHWHYPVLSLLFTSGLSVVMFGTIYLLGNHYPKHPRARASASKRTSKTPTPQTNIQVTTTWKWEYSGEGTATSDLAGSTTSTTTSTASINTPISNTSQSRLGLTWAKHKHYLACGLLLAGEGICSVFTTRYITYQWQIFAFQVFGILRVIRPLLTAYSSFSHLRTSLTSIC